MKAARIVLGVVGGLLLGYGVIRLGHGLPTASLAGLLGWAAAVVIVVLGLLLPLVVGLGVVLRRWVPDRPRGYLQAALIMIGAVMIIAIPLLLRQGSQPVAKAMLLQDYRVSVLVLLVIIVLGTLVAYVIGRTAGRPTPTRSSNA